MRIARECADVSQSRRSRLDFVATGRVPEKRFDRVGCPFFCLVGVGRRYRFCWCEACEECCGASAQNAPCLPSEHTALAHCGAGFCRTPCDFLSEDAPYSFGKCARTLSIFVADRLSFFYVGTGGACAQRVARDGSQVVRNPTVVVWAWCINVRFTYIRVRKKDCVTRCRNFDFIDLFLSAAAVVVMCCNWSGRGKRYTCNCLKRLGTYSVFDWRR